MGMNHNLGKPEVASAIDTAAYIGWRRHKQWISYPDLRERVWRYAMCHGVVDDDKPSASFLDLVRFAWKRAAYAKISKTIRFGNQDQVRYSQGMVRELLVDALDPGWVPVSSSDTTTPGKSVADPATAGTYMVSVMDVRRCFDRLPALSKLYLICRYRHNLEPELIGQELARDAPAVERGLTRAVSQLTALLNGSG